MQLQRRLPPSRIEERMPGPGPPACFGEAGVGLAKPVVICRPGKTDPRWHSPVAGESHRGCRRGQAQRRAHAWLGPGSCEAAEGEVTDGTR